jgi:uncharacterized protein (DUF1330 family)
MTMAAYLVGEVEITDAAGYDEYRKGVAATIAAHGGRFLARGGATEVLEGESPAKRFVIVEFPSAAKLKGWYESPEYRPLLELRKRSAESRLVLVEGV